MLLQAQLDKERSTKEELKESTKTPPWLVSSLSSCACCSMVRSKKYFCAEAASPLLCTARANKRRLSGRAPTQVLLRRGCEPTSLYGPCK